MSMPATAITDRPIVIPSAWTLHWTSIGTTDGNVPGPCLIILRYNGDKFLRKDLQPVTDDYMTSDVEWSERTDVGAIPFTPIETGGWAGARLRWIHRNKRTGGGFVMLDLPPGWQGAGSPARGPVEEFVLKGAITAGGEAFGKWRYAYRPAGQAGRKLCDRRRRALLSYLNGASELRGASFGAGLVGASTACGDGRLRVDFDKIRAMGRCRELGRSSGAIFSFQLGIDEAKCPPGPKASLRGKLI